MVTLAETRLAELEAVITRGFQTFIEVGEALAEIREKELWRGRYTSWSDYLDQRWDFKTSRARQIINGAHTARLVQTVTDVTLLNECQARKVNSALAAFPEAYRPAILDFSATLTGGTIDPPTIRAAGAVITDLIQTGTVDGSRNLREVMDTVITDEQYERMMRQREHLKDGQTPRVYILKPRAADKVVVDGETFTPPPGRRLFISLWLMDEADILGRAA